MEFFFEDEPQWFVIHTLTGYEGKVKAMIERQAQERGLADRILEIEIPMGEEVQSWGGEKRITKRKIFPGYVLIRMILDEQTRHLVERTNGVIGFIGAGEGPTPLTPEEADRILNRLREEAATPKPSWQKGDLVRVISGPFANFEGRVEEVNLGRETMKVMISLFGRETPVELSYTEVEKI